MCKLRLGIIGIGNMGSEHCRNIAAGLCPEIEISATADLRHDRRDWIRSFLGPSVPIFYSGDELIRNGLCDAVLIAAPHYQHEPLSVQALNAGLHVLCEKPIAVTVNQAERMLKAADASRKTLALMFNQRTNSVYRSIKALLDQNALGAIKRVSWTVTNWYRSQRYYDSGSWRATWKGEGGGVLLNQCPHQLDLLVWLCGMPSAVQAHCHEGKWHHIEVEDDVTAYLEFENGATGVFITSTGDLPGTNRLEISGELGKIICENGSTRLWKLDVSERTLCYESLEPWPHPLVHESVLSSDGKNPQHSGVLNAFAAHILRGEPLIASAEDGLCALALSNAIHLSSWTGEKIRLPADKALFDQILHHKISHSFLKDVADITYSTDHSDTGASLLS